MNRKLMLIVTAVHAGCAMSPDAGHLCVYDSHDGQEIAAWDGTPLDGPTEDEYVIAPCGLQPVDALAEGGW